MNTKHRNLNTPASGNSFPIGLILIRMQSMRGLPSSLSSSYLPLRPSRLISSIYLSRLHSLPSPEIIVHHRLTLYYVWTCLNVLFSSLSCLLPSSCWLRETMACAIQIKNVVGVFEHTKEGMGVGCNEQQDKWKVVKKKKRTESRTGLPTPSFCAGLCGGVWYR